MSLFGNLAGNLTGAITDPGQALRGLLPSGGTTSGLLGALGPAGLGPAALLGGSGLPNIGGNFGTLTGTTAGANPQLAPITPGVTQGQLSQGYAGTQGALNSQQALLQALQAQRGLTGQTNTYGQQAALTNQLGQAGGVGAQQQALAQSGALNQGLAGLGATQNLRSAYGQTQGLANEMAGANGVGNLGQALSAQEALAGQQQGVLGQYQDIAAGRGPNPALAALAQQTQQNVANQAALMAGQRGAGSNVGLLARQAAQQGAATQQQAVGEAATLQAQQQLAALQGITGQQQAIGQTQQNVANIAQQQVAQQQAQQQALAQQAAQQIGLQQAGISQGAGIGAGLTAQQQAQLQAQANQANLMAQNQIGATQAYTGAQQNQLQNLYGALGQQNQANVSNQGNVNQANATLAGAALKGRQDLTGGLLNAGGQGAAAALGAKGGMVKKPKRMYDGGDTMQQPAAPSAPQVATPQAPVVQPAAVTAPVVGNMPAPGANQPQSSFAKFLKGAATQTPDQASQQNQSQLEKGTSQFATGVGKAVYGMMHKPDTSESVAGEDMPATDITNMSAKGGMAKRHDYTTGGNVKAKNKDEKAVKSGNSYSNDKIKAYLSEGEVVLPRSVMQSKDPVRASADFVAKVLAKRRRSA